MIDPRSLPAILSDAAGAGLLAVGALGVAFPSPLARGFGAPLQDERAAVFVRATGARDAALGAIVLAASIRGSADALAVASGACVAISLADFLNAYYAAGCVLRREHAVHLGGAALFAAILAMLYPELT